MTTRRSPLLLLALFVIGRFGVADAQPLQPYDLYDPCHPCQSKQWTSWIQYADHSDEYLVAYPGEFSTLTFGYGSILRMDPDGNYLGSKIITTMTGVSDVSLAYNPDDDQFLFVWRTTATNVYAAYLDGDGDPVAGLWKGVDGINRAYIYLGTGGNLPKVAYSKTAGKYLVVFNKPPGIIPSRLIDGDSSNAMPVLDSDFVTTINGTAASVAAGSDRFMVGYVNFSSNSDVYGRFVDNNGTPGQNFAVATHPLGVQNPVVGYHSGIDRFIISYSTWAAQPPDIGVRVINPANGAATNTFTLAFTSAWEINGGISYNPVTDTVVFSWSHGDDFFPASYTPRVHRLRHGEHSRRSAGAADRSPQRGPELGRAHEPGAAAGRDRLQGAQRRRGRIRRHLEYQSASAGRDRARRGRHLRRGGPGRGAGHDQLERAGRRRQHRYRGHLRPALFALDALRLRHRDPGRRRALTGRRGNPAVGHHLRSSR